MTMQIITEAEAALHHAESLLASIGHAGAAKVRSLLAELRGDAGTIQHDAETDGVELAKDADASLGPIVAEAEKDATALGGEAVADATKAATDATPPPAS